MLLSLAHLISITSGVVWAPGCHPSVFAKGCCVLLEASKMKPATALQPPEPSFLGRSLLGCPLYVGITVHRSGCKWTTVLLRGSPEEQGVTTGGRRREMKAKAGALVARDLSLDQTLDFPVLVFSLPHPFSMLLVVAPM